MRDIVSIDNAVECVERFKTRQHVGGLAGGGPVVAVELKVSLVEGGVRPRTLHLQSAGESCADVCPVESNVYEGKCGWFTRKNDKKWCTSPFYTVDICCTSGSSDDCCVLDEGRVAGVAVGIFVVISLNVIACCYCCKCCCFNYRRKQFSPAPPAVVYVTQPGVQMQQR